MHYRVVSVQCNASNSIALYCIIELFLSRYVCIEHIHMYRVVSVQIGTTPNTEKSFPNLIKLNSNLIVFTMHRLIWNQTDVRMVPNQSENGAYLFNVDRQVRRWRPALLHASSGVFSCGWRDRCGIHSAGHTQDRAPSFRSTPFRPRRFHPIHFV